MSVGRRWLYIFGTEGGDAVKVGLVLTENRLAPRLREGRAGVQAGQPPGVGIGPIGWGESP